MNRYPLWKNLIVIVAILLGALYSAPNLFGEVPAVQVSPARSVDKPDAALLARVEEILAKGGIAAEGAFVDASGVKVRFASTETQIKAKDLIQEQLGSGYIVALNLLSASPNWLARLGALPMYLGLDLRGGVHFLLQVDMKAALDTAAERFAGDMRTLLRERKVQHAGITRQGQTVVARFRDAQARDKAAGEIRKDIPDLALREGGSGDELTLVASLTPQAQKRIQEFAIQQNITTLRNRVNELGVAEPIIQQAGADRVVVQLPGVQDTAKAKDILGRTATLEVRMVDEEHQDDPAAQEKARAGQPPLGTEFFTDRGGRGYILKKNVVLTGERINDAQPGFDEHGAPAVHISLDGSGARIFKNVTRENVGKRMAILLIEKGRAEVVTAPVIRAEIGGGRVQISGAMTTDEARDISLLLRAGALSAPMEIVEERTVGPSLGAENIAKGFNSTVYGFAAIALFMSVYYGLFGVFSTLALAANLLLLVGLLSMLQATLTLPGMAGIALTVGMAIDANVLINERVREELRNGLSPHAAIAAGYDRAFDTILDSNVTTLIAGVALFAFGSGPVRGFAVVLCLGILTSIFSAVLVSRALVNWKYGRQARLERVSIGTVQW